MKIKIIIIIIISAILVSFVLFFLNQKSGSNIKYTTQTVLKGNIEKSIVSTGTIYASQLINIGAQVSGQVKKIHIHIGDIVKKDQLIAEIDSTKQLNDLSTAKAILINYEAQHNLRKIAFNIAQNKYNRQALLRKSDFISQEDLENAKDKLEISRASLAEIESLIVQGKISVDTATANLRYTQIVAPTDGTIISLPVEEGQTINAAQSTPTIALLAILDTMNIKIKLSEADITKISPGLQIIFKTLSEPKFSHEAVLQSIDPANTETTDNTTENITKKKQAESAVYYYGKAILDNKKNVFRIGMTVLCKIVISQKSGVLIIPSSSIHSENDRTYVFILENSGDISPKTVTTGESDFINTEITNGLSSGDILVTSKITNDEIEIKSSVTQ